MELDQRVLRKSVREKYAAPPWAYEVASRVTRRVLPKYKGKLPEILLLPKPDDRSFGGRHYPRAQVIAIYEVDDKKVVGAVLLHEMTHWLLTRQGDGRGAHDAKFGALCERLYRLYGVNPTTARYVEQICDTPGSYCQHW
jgi:hypothetical protein